MAIVNLLALLPLAILVIIQVRDFEVKNLEAQSNAAFAHTLASAQAQIGLINGAQSLSRTLASTLLSVTDNPQDCRKLMTKVGAAYPEFSFIGFIPVSGMMSCSSTGEVHDFSHTLFFEKLLESNGTAQVLNRWAPLSQMAVIGTAYPVYDAANALVGIVTVSVPHATPVKVAMDDRTKHVVDSVDFLVTFDVSGTLLTSSLDIHEASSHLPYAQSLAELASKGEQSFISPDGHGQTRIYSVVHITEELFLLGSWAPKSSATLLPDTIAPYVLVVLIIISGLIAAAFAADQLVVRHVRRLANAMMSFASDRERSDPPILLHPPSEIAELAETYALLLGVLRRDEKEMASLLSQKEQLLREVHHRTGNSLQLIVSILRMHIRESKDEALTAVLRHLLERTMSLSTVHLGLYKVAGSHGIAVDELLKNVIDKVDSLHAAQSGQHNILAEFSPLHIATHQAVPLALLVTELLSSFLGALGAKSHEKITFKLKTISPYVAELSVAGPLESEAPITGQSGNSIDLISARLIRSFVRQLDGAMLVDTDEELFYFKVQFRIDIIQN